MELGGDERAGSCSFQDGERDRGDALNLALPTDDVAREREMVAQPTSRGRGRDERGRAAAREITSARERVCAFFLRLGLATAEKEKWGNEF